MARFEVFGAVTVSFLEAEPGFVKKGTGKKHNSFFARTWLSTPTNTTTTTQKVFTTGRYAFHTHFMGGEEVLYRHVSSNQAIVVEVHHASADNDPRVSDDYASAVIPILSKMPATMPTDTRPKPRILRVPMHVPELKTIEANYLRLRCAL